MRRIAAVWLPRLLCEIAGEGKEEKAENEGAVPSSRVRLAVAIEPSETLSEVNEAAHRAGVRMGQKVTEARAIASDLVVRRVSPFAIRAALGRIAELLLAFGPTVGFVLGDEPASETSKTSETSNISNTSKTSDTSNTSDTSDTSKTDANTVTGTNTVWVDLTTSAHLFGGEEAAALEIAARVKALGHTVRVVIADGPYLARAVARYTKHRETIVPALQGERVLSELPLDALSLDSSIVTWMARLGVWTVGDLLRLPLGPTRARLGARASRALALARGIDEAPLVAYEPPRMPREAIEWDDLVTSVESLEFAARGLVARLSARLEGRGEATQSLRLEIGFDRAIARHEGKNDAKAIPIELPLALWRKDELFRIVRSKLELIELEAPVRSFAIVATRLTHARRTQLDFGGGARSPSPEQLAVLVAELAVDFGRENVGVLEFSPSHRPEACSRLRVPRSVVRDAAVRSARNAVGRDTAIAERPLRGFWPSRVLAEPMRLHEAIGVGRLATINLRLFRIEHIRPVMRLEGVAWWTDSSISRDYFRVRFSRSNVDTEGWVFFDRVSGASFLHGWYD